MRTNVTGSMEKLPSPSDIKVHSVICTQLIKLVDRIGQILPEIEAAKPQCLTGLDYLCLLVGGLDEAKSVIKECCESSKLYLALNGTKVLSRCNKSKRLLEQNLSKIQNMVHVMLAAKIYQITEELRIVKFSLDPSEEEAGKTVRLLVEAYRPGNRSEREYENERIQLAAQKLHITSSKARSLERESIKKLLGQLDEGSSSKKQKQTLLLFSHLLTKYGKSLESIENTYNVQNHEYSSQTVDLKVDYEKDMSCPPPEEFKCSISHKLMYDPVVIDSGQTFERMWIQKWLKEGHDTCPKTEKKLLNHSLVPNTEMKDQISKWCETHGVTVSDPLISFSNDADSWEDSTSSVNSLSSMYSLLSVDYSISSMSSLENSGVVEGTPEYDGELSTEIDDALPWEFQCKFIEDLMTRLKNDDQACKLISCEKLVGSLVRFLKVARNINDVNAQRIGCLLLRILVTKSRSIQYLSRDAYQLISEFLDSEVKEEALAITNELSVHQNCRSEIASSGSIPYVLKILDTKIRGIQKSALNILLNLTSTRNVCSSNVYSEIIPKLVTLSEDDSMWKYCIAILNNLCGTDDNKSIIAATKGCLTFVAKVLASDNCEEQEQEHALDILLSLCSQSNQYCRLVMDEDVHLPLCFISKNGNDKGKAKACEMLRIIGDIKL